MVKWMAMNVYGLNRYDPHGIQTVQQQSRYRCSLVENSLLRLVQAEDYDTGGRVTLRRPHFHQLPALVELVAAL